MEKIIQFLLGECRKDESVGTDRGRLRYIIYRRRTWDYRTGWAEEPYTGASPHDEHAHFSADYDSAKEADTRPWGIVDKFGDDVSEEDVTNALNKFFTRTDMPDPALPGAATSKTGLDVWYHGIPNGEGQQEKAYQVVNLMAQRIVQLVSMVSELAGRDLADEAAIAQAILAGLTPAAMTDAMIVALQAIPAETAKEVLDAIRQALATAAK
jgi:hypothetical protein